MGTRHFPRSLGLEILAKLGRIAPRELYARPEIVIAREAKQSISPRKKQWIACAPGKAGVILPVKVRSG